MLVAQMFSGVVNMVSRGVLERRVGILIMVLSGVFKPHAE